MHMIVPVIHTEGVDVDDYFSKFLFNNPDYQEFSELFSVKEILEQVDSRIQELENSQEITDYDKSFLQKAKDCSTDEEKIAFYIEWESYEPDNLGNYGYLSNPIGECDWYEIGGRWSGSLVGWDGSEHDTINVHDLSIENSIQDVYGFALEYRDEDYVERSASPDEWKQVIREALEYSELHDKAIYITLVDMHY